MSDPEPSSESRASINAWRLLPLPEISTVVLSSVIVSGTQQFASQNLPAVTSPITQQSMPSICRVRDQSYRHAPGFCQHHHANTTIESTQHFSFRLCGLPAAATWNMAGSAPGARIDRQTQACRKNPGDVFGQTTARYVSQAVDTAGLEQLPGPA